MTTSDALSNGTIQASRIPRSTSSTLHDKPREESISPIPRKPRSQDGTIQRVRRPLSRGLLPFPPPPSNPRRQECYLILHPNDDKAERRVVMVPGPGTAPVRVGRVVNPKTPAKFDNMLFDTKVLSRNHAEVFCDANGRVYIRDLGSSNGTYINGFRLSPDAVASEPFQLLPGQELALGIDIREETNQENIAYHRVWFTVEHVGTMSPPPLDAPTPSTLGAVDLDPWIPKPSTRDIVDHLVQEINAAKQIAEEITAVQGVLDGMMEGDEQGGMEKVQRMLEERTARVEELERNLFVERETRRVLEERIKVMEDERAEKLMQATDENNDTNDETTAKQDANTTTETLVNKEEPVVTLAIPVVEDLPKDPTIEISPPTSPSTAPSSPIQETSRSISPISLPSTESSNNETTPLLEKISVLESLLAAARTEIAEYQSKVPVMTPSTPVIGPVTAAVTSVDFPFTFTPPSKSRRHASLRTRRRKSDVSEVKEEFKGHDVDTGKDRELLDGLAAAVGVVVLGWMGMWLVNHLVERGGRVVK